MCNNGKKFIRVFTARPTDTANHSMHHHNYLWRNLRHFMQRGQSSLNLWKCPYYYTENKHISSSLVICPYQAICYKQQGKGVEVNHYSFVHKLLRMCLGIFSLSFFLYQYLFIIPGIIPKNTGPFSMRYIVLFK